MRSLPPALRTPGSSGKVAAMLALALDLLASGKSAAEEGRDIILMMLAVGLIFVGVALGGDLLNRLRKKH